MSEKVQSVNQLQSDLSYLKNVVRRKEGQTSHSISIPLLWAAINLVGWSLYDFSITGANRFWMVAVPIGMLLSFALGYRHSRTHGELDPQLGKLNLWHWMTIPVAATALGFVLGPLNLPHPALLQCLLLVIGLVYLLGGVHLDRTFLPGGIVLIGCVFLVGLVPYTVVGLLVSFGLAAGVIDAVRRGRQ